MANYLPHTDQDVASMLDFLGLDSLDDLFAHIPAAVRVAGGLELPPGQSEPDVKVFFDRLERANVARRDQMTCFAGAGAYDHEVPPVVRALASRSEFVTAYTPYQPEVAQGVLQAIFEYQTLVSRISGLPVPNASLYDGATALVEALNMAVGDRGRSRIVLSEGVHPHWRATVETFARGTGHVLDYVQLRNGVTDWTAVAPGEAAAVVAAYPNYLGFLEEPSAARAVADQAGALLVLGADPVAAALLKTAGEWGADIFVAEGQPFGVSLAFGGPYLGLFACREELIRRLPGRIVGETLDNQGRRAFVTTLRAREQDIRREKATSNICSNQTLMAVGAAIQLGWLGTQGYREVATRCAQGAHYLADLVQAQTSARLISTAPFFREFTVELPIAASRIIDEMAARGVLAGVSVSALHAADATATGDDRQLIITVTERRTRAELDHFVSQLSEVLS